MRPAYLASSREFRSTDTRDLFPIGLHDRGEERLPPHLPGEACLFEVSAEIPIGVLWLKKIRHLQKREVSAGSIGPLSM
jgi:hypothetical protein